ncbi:MAG: hypothetical protein JW706_03775 [Opitutales bacterium]|nr:hypothetical protein [Opitutales bacterium]
MQAPDHPVSGPSPVITDIVVPVQASENQEAWKSAIAERLGISTSSIRGMRLLKHSIDSRQRNIKAQLRIMVGIGADLPPQPPLSNTLPIVPSGAPVLLIVGCGPCGMFAAIRAIELGWKPVILERGKDASTRRRDLAPILREGRVIPNSNYCFGEGGAGTFSDGKLYTRATKRGPVQRVYEVFVANGAPERILIDAHPHIGSNLLPRVVMSIRDSIIAAGGEVHFGQRMTRLITDPKYGSACGVETAEGLTFSADAVLLATGHSARDVYRQFAGQGIRMEAKPFAVGVRIEHEQSLIDAIQYHLRPGETRPRYLPAARYNLATKIRDRGVHSFCMCPGGFIVPCATENDEVVVNGMSLSRRDSRFANSGIVVTIEPEDTTALESEHGILAGIAFQRQLEVAAAVAGGGMQKAPAQRAVDFIAGKLSSNLPETSYFPGITHAPLHEILPAFIVERMREGLELFGRQMPGFLNKDALLIGFETRTSSPLRIPRDPDTFQHPDIPMLFPCGEGAGFAGGIVSAALDGMKGAECACTAIKAQSAKTSPLPQKPQTS